MIKRTYSLKAKITSATGILSKQYKDATLEGTLVAVGEEIVFRTSIGELVISGNINKAVDSKGKDIDLAKLQTTFKLELNFSNEKVFIRSPTIVFTKDNSKVKIDFIAHLTTELIEIKDFQNTFKLKNPWIGMLANNIVIDGYGSRSMPDEIIGDVVPEPPPDTPPNPDIPPIPQPTTFNPMIGISGLTYYWHTANQQNTLKLGLSTIANICDELNIPRSVVIFPIEIHSDGGRPGAGANWKEHYSSRCSEAVGVVSIIKSYGFGCEVIAWNSNTPGKGYSSTWNKGDVEGNKKFILDNMRPMIQKIGWDRVLWLLCNENDSSTPSTIQSAIKGLKSEMKIPDNRYLPDDVHPGHVSSLPELHKPQTFTSDNGSIIGELYDNSDYWKASGFNVANHKKVIDKYVNKVLFNYYNLVLEETINKHKDKWKEVLAYFKSKAVIDVTPIPPGPGPTPTTGLQPSQVNWLSSRGKNYKNAKIVFNITSARIDGNRLYFKTDRPFPEPWVEREKGVNSVGFLIRKIGSEYIGGKCEWCVEGRGWYDIATNVASGYNGHTMPQPGEIVWCGIGHPDNGSECSSLIEVKWPTSRSLETDESRSGSSYSGEFPNLEA